MVRRLASSILLLSAVALGGVAACNGTEDTDAACPLAGPAATASELAAFGLDPALSEVPVPPPTEPESVGVGPIAHAPTDVVVRVAGTTQKICQLTGEVDRALGAPTVNRTQSRAGMIGTDLGFSFEHNGKLAFLFGDTAADTDRIDRHYNEDAMAFTTDTDASQCLKLQFNLNSDGGFRPVHIPGIANGTFEVPAGGVSVNGKMYVYFTTDHSDQKIMGRSVVGVSVNDGRDFTGLYDFSTDKFIYVDPVKVSTNDYPELPDQSSDTSVLFFGDGYDRGDAYLASAPSSGIESKDKLRYFAGLDPTSQTPHWSSQETDAQPLFDACINEYSVTWNPYLSKWLILYNCWRSSSVNLRTADKPWGPWSAPQTVFDGADDHAYCHYMHRAWRKVGCAQLPAAQTPAVSSANEEDLVSGVLCADPASVCDCVSDPGQQGEESAVYGPFMIPRLFTANATGSTIYFTLSLHNPYNVVLMKARLGFVAPTAVPAPSSSTP
jgi:hypothetical protein